MTALSFRDLDREIYDSPFGLGAQTKGFAPLWSIINSRKQEGGERGYDDTLLSYLNSTIRVLMEWRRPISLVQRMNSLLYRGRHFLNRDPMLALRYQGRINNLSKEAKIVLNYLGKAADSYVAEMSGYEPALAVRPHNDEESDRVSARMNKMALDHYFYCLRMKIKFLPFHLLTVTHGEAFMFAGWDPSKGDVHPKYKEYLEMQRSMGIEDKGVPLVDPETGDQIEDQEGNPIFIQTSVKTGDIEVKVEMSERVLYPEPPSFLWEDVDYIHQLIPMPIDEVKARWPKYAGDIRADAMYSDYIGPYDRSLHETVMIRKTYHRPTEFLENGATIYSTEHCILQRGDKEFNHDKLPCIRATDIDTPHSVTGMSRFQNLTTLNQALNNSTSGILQNQMQFAYPKYAAPRGAKVRYVQLGDDRGIYEYSGQIKPELMAKNSTPEDTWRWRENLKNEFNLLAMLEGPQSGQAPQGITANVALRMLEEQHRKLRKPSIDKHGANVEDLGMLMLATLGTYRDPLDGSLISVLGKNNERYLQYFDTQNLSKPYTVELVKTSGFPDSPAAKTQTVIDLNASFPGMWDHDEVLEVLDIQRPEKLIESATLARQAAESEVEDIMSGIPVPPLAPYHDILPRYKVYEKAVQSRSFDDAIPEVKQMMINHIITAEYIMMKKAKLNPMFGQMLLQKFPNFPMYFPSAATQEPPMMLAQPPQMMPGDPMGAPPLGGAPPMMSAAQTQLPPASSQTPLPGNLPQPEVPDVGALP